MKILLLDDEASFLGALKRMLVRLGHEVDCSTDAGAAVGMVEAGSYDMAFVDYRMPERDGEWFMSNARIPRSTKVLLMTGLASHDVIGRMFRLGVRGYMIKPIDTDDLRTQLSFHAEGVG